MKARRNAIILFILRQRTAWPSVKRAARDELYEERLHQSQRKMNYRNRRLNAEHRNSLPHTSRHGYFQKLSHVKRGWKLTLEATKSDGDLCILFFSVAATSG